MVQYITKFNCFQKTCSNYFSGIQNYFSNVSELNVRQKHLFLIVVLLNLSRAHYHQPRQHLGARILNYNHKFAAILYI